MRIAAKIKPVRPDIEEYLNGRGLEKKWAKAKRIFETNPRHPSLHMELLEPRWRGIYSFRIDRKYRALFFFTETGVEVFKVTDHYKK